jgi:hypothetical protein
MAAARLNMKMVEVIMGNSSSIKTKDMVHYCVLRETLTRGNSSKVNVMVME